MNKVENVFNKLAGLPVVTPFEVKGKADLNSPGGYLKELGNRTVSWCISTYTRV